MSKPVNEIDSTYLKIYHWQYLFNASSMTILTVVLLAAAHKYQGFRFPAGFTLGATLSMWIVLYHCYLTRKPTP